MGALEPPIGYLNMFDKVILQVSNLTSSFKPKLSIVFILIKKLLCSTNDRIPKESLIYIGINIRIKIQVKKNNLKILFIRFRFCLRYNIKHTKQLTISITRSVLLAIINVSIIVIIKVINTAILYHSLYCLVKIIIGNIAPIKISLLPCVVAAVSVPDHMSYINRL